MYRVVTKRFLNDAKTICYFEIEAPLIARHAQAGQFVVFRLDEQGERVPVSVAGYDREKGTVSVMVQAAGRTTKMLHTVEQGDVISDIVGPLGKATEMEGLKKVCVVGGGVGCAIAYPIAKEMHEKGIDVTFIAGFRSADIVILKDELKAASDKLIICTDDGTYGEKGFTTVYLKQEIEANIAEGKPQFDRVIAIGPDIIPRPDHGRRHRHVRLLPRDRGRRDEVRLRRRAGLRRAQGRFRLAHQARRFLRGRAGRGRQAHLPHDRR